MARLCANARSQACARNAGAVRPVDRAALLARRDPRAPRHGGRGTIAAERDADCRFARRSEEHTSELQSLMRISYAVFCLNTKIHNNTHTTSSYTTKLYHVSSTTT